MLHRDPSFAAHLMVVTLAFLAFAVLFGPSLYKRYGPASSSGWLAVINSANWRAMRLLGFVLFIVGDCILGGKDLTVTTQDGKYTQYRIAYDPLKCPFDAEGGLYIGTNYFGHPQMRRLCQMRGLGFVEIESLDQLKGHVKIHSDAGALAYVRLITNTLTRDSFWSDDFYEVIATEDVTPELEYGDAEEADSLHKYFDEGEDGIVPRHWMAANHIPTAKVSPDLSGWVIHRMCLRLTREGKWNAFLLSEFVSSNGSYSRSEQAITIKAPPGKGWHAYFDE